jgi:hypothetical protein
MSLRGTKLMIVGNRFRRRLLVTRHIQNRRWRIFVPMGIRGMGTSTL